jgi:hypothetical protein
VQPAAAGDIDADYHEGDGERPGNRPLACDPEQDEPGQQDRPDLPRMRGEAAYRRQAQLKHDPGQHRLRDRCRDRRDEAAKQGPQPGDDDERAHDQERADGRGPAAVDDAGAGQERRTGSGPGERERDAVPARQPQHAQCLGRADGEEAGSRFGRRGADRAKAGEDDGEGTGEPDQCGQDAGEDGLTAPDLFHTQNTRCRSRRSSLTGRHTCARGPALRIPCSRVMTSEDGLRSVPLGARKISPVCMKVTWWRGCITRTRSGY